MYAQRGNNLNLMLDKENEEKCEKKLMETINFKKYHEVAISCSTYPRKKFHFVILKYFPLILYVASI